MNRRDFVRNTSLAAAGMALSRFSFAESSDLQPIFAEVDKRHDEAVQRLQSWIRQPSIAAENRGMDEGCKMMMDLLTDAGFQHVEKVPTDGKPGVYATLDAGAPRSVGLYYMYDVKQADPSEWSSPPFEAALVDKPDVGKCVVGRGAVNQKGPESACLAALHAIRGAGKKLPVNIVFVAEGEEEIGSPHFPQVVRRPETAAALKKTLGVFMPSASQDLDGTVTTTYGSKGVIELELVSSGEKWGRGPSKDVHSSLKATLDSPQWHLIEALATLVKPDGNTIAIENYTKDVRPITPEEKAMIADAAKRMSEETRKKQFGVQHWMNDAGWEQSLINLQTLPTVNIEGLVGGYTGPGGKTVLGHRALAKMDLRLVPNMTAQGALAALKAHLEKHGFGDIEVNMTGGYDPTSTPYDAEIIKVEEAVYKHHGIDPIKLPRNAGSWPGYVFTGEPLKLGASHFGLGHGSGAHAPNEYYVVESSNPKVQGFDGAVKSFVEYFYQLASV